MNNKKLVIRTLLISVLTCGLIFAILVYAKDNASNTAVVTYTDGFVDIKLMGTENWTPLIEGTEVKEGDEIETGTEGEVELKLSDRSVLKIGPDSRVVIKEMGMVEITEVRTSTFGLIRGKIRAVVTPFMKKESKFSIETENATVGVRGTDFGTTFDPDTGQTNVISISDCVSVVATNFPSLDPIDVCTSEELMVYSDVEPGDVVGVDKEKLEKFLDEMEIKGEEIVSPLDAEPPYISRAFVNNRIDLEDVDDRLSLTKDDLNTDGKVYVSGDAADDRYIVSSVEYSLDGGGIWDVATGTDHWYFEFVPQEDIEYELMLRAENDKGAVSDPYDIGPWEITYLNLDYEEMARNFLDRFVNCFETMDISCMDEIISDDYDGVFHESFSKDELLDDLESGPFSEANSIDVSYQINQINTTADSIICSLRWTISENYDFDNITEQSNVKIWLSKEDEYRAVHTEGNIVSVSDVTAELTLEKFFGTPWITDCEDVVRILLTVPDVPKSETSVIVEVETFCSITGVTLTRSYYESYTGDDYGFGGEYRIYDIYGGPFSCSIVPGGCPTSSIGFDGNLGDTFDVWYNDYGYDLSDSITLP